MFWLLLISFDLQLLKMLSFLYSLVFLLYCTHYTDKTCLFKHSVVFAIKFHHMRRITHSLLLSLGVKLCHYSCWSIQFLDYLNKWSNVRHNHTLQMDVAETSLCLIDQLLSANNSNIPSPLVTCSHFTDILMSLFYLLITHITPTVLMTVQTMEALLMLTSLFKNLHSKLATLLLQVDALPFSKTVLQFPLQHSRNSIPFHSKKLEKSHSWP